MIGQANGVSQSPLPEKSDGEGSSPSRRLRWTVFTAFTTLWLAFLALGQVRARFWIRNEFQIEWRSVTGVWRVALGELPGGTAVQALVLISAAVIAFGVIGCLYMILVPSCDAEDPARELS